MIRIATPKPAVKLIKRRKRGCARCPGGRFLTTRRRIVRRTGWRVAGGPPAEAAVFISSAAGVFSCFPADADAGLTALFGLGFLAGSRRLPTGAFPRPVPDLPGFLSFSGPSFGVSVMYPTYALLFVSVRRRFFASIIPARRRLVQMCTNLKTVIKMAVTSIIIGRNRPNLV